MPQRKKKINSFQKQKLAKAHHKKEFLHKLSHFINTISGEDTSSTLPQAILETIYEQRPHSFKVILDDGCKAPAHLINNTRVILQELTRIDKITIIPDKLEVTLEDFYTVCISIWLLENSMNNESFPFVPPFKKGVKTFMDDFENLYSQAGKRLAQSLRTFSIIDSDLGKYLYWTKHEMVRTPAPRNGIDNLITVYNEEPETISVELDGNKRPARRLGFALNEEGPIWLDLKPSQLNIQGPFAEIPLNVYIQSHALQRLSERIDCFATGVVHFNMFESIKNPKVFHDDHNNILIEFRVFDTKAGYFMVTVSEGMIIIRTFLFITNTGTPEGQKLEKITGLQKLDKKYLAIDKLSTFMDSDIKENKEVQTIFEKAGCNCLIELYEKMQPLVVKHATRLDTNLMLNYLASGNDNYSNSLPDYSFLKTLS